MNAMKSNSYARSKHTMKTGSLGPMTGTLIGHAKSRNVWAGLVNMAATVPPGAALVLCEPRAGGPAGLVRVARLSEGVRGFDTVAIRGGRDDRRVRVGRDARARRRDPGIDAGRPRLALDDESGGAARIVHPVQCELSRTLSRSLSPGGEESAGDHQCAENLPKDPGG